MNKPTVLTFVGTRPEAVKMAPVLLALNKHQNDVTSLLCSTGQHEELTYQALDVFELKIHEKITLQRRGSDLAELTSELLEEIAMVLERVAPDLVLVHGDTTTAFAASLAAFYKHIPVGHVEAGLRTSRFESPFPEEMNRRLIARIAEFHFAPTANAMQNLFIEAVNGKICVTGNTVVDALQYILNQPYYPSLNKFPLSKEVILITCHRRESWGPPLQKLCHTILELANEHSDYYFVWPVHGNPILAGEVRRYLSGVSNVKLTLPLNYKDFIWLLKVCDLVITDSGGVMEEAAVLNRPALILRSETERPEALDLPNIELVGYDFNLLKQKVVKFLRLLPSDKWNAVFGDGQAGAEIADVVVNHLLKKGVKHGSTED